MRAVGENADLSAGVATRLDAALEKRHAQQADGHLLAGRHYDVELARVGVGLNLLGKGDEPVGFSTHCRNYDNELMSGGLELGDAPRDAPDSLGGADRSPAVFLNDQRHAVL